MDTLGQYFRAKKQDMVAGDSRLMHSQQGLVYMYLQLCRSASAHKHHST